MLDKIYKPSELEPRIARVWEDAQAFKSGRRERADAKPFTIVIPPPNVTGTLHIGHALNNTLQDILARFERMRGRDVLWQPGMDHAGIATQMVVERQLAERGEPGRRELGREKFVEKIWQWKEESGGMILATLRRLGSSCDWSRERFTMDEGLSRAVIKVFVDMHKDGLIYRDKRLVNWDPKFETAISDLEVEQIEVKGSLWHFRYPLKGGLTYKAPCEFDEDGKATAWETRDYIVVATTRPETMLGDTGVAVHPDDERYRDLIGKKIILPLVGREIAIVGDEHADPETGSGAVKITPAHDFNDFEVGRRCDLDQINVLDAHGAIIAGDEADAVDIPESYRGLDRFAARKKIVSDIDALGLLEKIEKHTHPVPHGDRSGVPIEPWLTDQWYVDAARLAIPAIEAVESDKTEFVPKTWEKTYFEWMRNIQPWCVSRQLWWGHQIPAWYGPDGEVFVAADAAQAQAAADKHYGTKANSLTRDEDVLDTWFSSGLWAFSTLGWPDDTKELARHYPTNTLVTGFDIIFFWIARMMMMSLYCMKKVPFDTVYVHALVRDAKGAKMSKSKGNVIDPLDLIDGIDLDALVEKRTASLLDKREAKKVAKATRADYADGIPSYGADALRFTLAAMAAQGRDIKLALPRVEGYRNFATKLWNAARFAEMNEAQRDDNFAASAVNETINKWIVGETERTAYKITAALEDYKFNEAANGVYQFVWGVYCDWYLELIKPIMNGDDEAAKAETRATLAWALDQILVLLHPFMPFITEELWARTADHGTPRAQPLVLSPWVTLEGLQNKTADDEIEWVISLVEAVRSVRSEMNVPAGAKVPLILIGAEKTVKARASHHEPTIAQLARLDEISFADAPPKGSVQVVLGDVTLALPLADIIDMAGETKRLAREIEKAEAEIAKIDGKMGNKQFMDKAPKHVVDENRARRVAFANTVTQLSAAIKRLEELG